MKKVLIVTYCFPPCNLTPSQRVFSWAKYLNLFGWYPVFVCRNWDREITNDIDLYISTQNTHVVHEKKEGYEIYWLPYRSNLRDKLMIRYGKQKWSSIRKILSYLYGYLEKLTVTFNPLGNYDFFVNTFLQSNKVDGIYITGNPFVLYKIGYTVNKRYNIPWAVDYRDSWSVDDLNYSDNLFSSLQHRFDRVIEKRWTKTVSFFTTISPQYVTKISSFIKKQGYTIYNGFFDEDFAGLSNELQFEPFTITYLGTLYPQQKIETFLEGVIRFIESKNGNLKLQIMFPGLAYINSQKERVLEIMKGYEKYLVISERLQRKEVLKIEKKSHLLLQVGWDAHDGIVGSKVYEYMASGRPIVICPSDKGILESTITETQSGFILNSEDEVFQLLNKLYSEHQEKTCIDFSPNMEKINFYSRRNQAHQLALCFNRHF